MKICRDILFAHLRLHIYDFLLIAILIFAFYIRIVNIIDYYPIDMADVARDYLVSSHIIPYKEFPSIGPYASNDLVRNSPVYYYLLAFFLIFSNDIFSLGVANIILQIVTIFIIYILARELFSRPTALLASFLFAFSSVSLYQSSFMWQPQAMQPFINLTYLLLVLAYTRKNYNLLLGSLFLLLFSLVIHLSVAVLVPLFLVLSVVIMKTLRKSIYYYLFTVLFFLSLSIFFVYPIINYQVVNKQSVLTINHPIVTTSFSTFVSNFINSTKEFLNNLFPGQNENYSFLNYLVIFMVILSGIFYFFKRKIQLRSKYYFLIILSVIIFFIIVYSVIDKNIPIYGYYFTPIFGISVIIVSEIIHSLYSRSTLLRICKIFLIVIFFFVMSSKFSFVTKGSNQKIMILNSAVNGIREEIVKIKKDENRSDLNFFQIRIYRENQDISGFDTIFWVPLEKAFQTKFTKVIDNLENIWSINDDKYIFLVCLTEDDQSNQVVCVNSFLQKSAFYNLNYTIVKKIYNKIPYIIFLMRRYD